MSHLIMIEVQKINGEIFYVNPDLIKIIEVKPDTLITFTDGDRLMVQTKPEEIIQRLVNFRRQCERLPEVKS